ncbi:MAG TPA: aldo/keto reductase [Solirubrobacterales bacterium]|nr:aldo/keto reductase [Solirubrobacterales bacterium]
MANAKVSLGETPVARIGLGTNRLADTPENVAFIREAVAAGVGMIDTAHVYAGGESEATIGAALSGSSGGCVVATKGGYGDARPDVLGGQIEESLRRLQTEIIGLYYLHKPDPGTPIEESVGVIEEHRQRGSIRYIGVSNVSLVEVERARSVAPIAAVQNHYNLGERSADDVVDFCARNDVVFVPYFPLREKGGPAAAGIAKRHGATAHQISLAWLLRRSPTTLPIPGTLSIEHLRENLAALEIKLSDEEFEALR